MTNKYQDALNELCSRCYVESEKCTCHPKYKGGKCNNNCEHKQILQELVDKKTPMKPIRYNINQYKCPKCLGQIKGQKWVYNMETKRFDIKCKIKPTKIFCPYCNQKLDWSDECE